MSLKEIFLAIAGVVVAAQLAGCAAAVGAGAASGAVAATDRRSTGTFVDDELIEWKVLKSLSDNAELWRQGHINVTSYNNMVLLSGEVPSEPLKGAADDAARTHPKVRGVFNELTIAAPSSLLSRSSDTVVTGKVKTALLTQQETLATRVKVVTENGTVFLMGLVTQAEAANITEVTRRVGGVQRVVRLFEYLD
jgi:osmotically-inducible protein OsmY